MRRIIPVVGVFGEAWRSSRWSSLFNVETKVRQIIKRFGLFRCKQLPDLCLNFGVFQVDLVPERFPKFMDPLVTLLGDALNLHLLFIRKVQMAV